MTATQNRPDSLGPDATAASRGDRSDRPQTRRNVPRSRMGGVWVALLTAAFVLLLLLVFILQNGQRAEVSFLGAHGQLPMGVALLLAAVFGALLVALPGTARIIQLRMLSRRHGDRGRSPTPQPNLPAAPPDEPAG